MPLCHQCQKACKDYHELADHIVSSKGHKKGKRWALRYLAINGLSPGKRRELPKRAVIDPNYERTEYGDENRKKLHQPFSGQQRSVVTVCPRCRQKEKRALPVEYTDSPYSWRIEGTLVRICLRCGGKGP